MRWLARIRGAVLVGMFALLCACSQQRSRPVAPLLEVVVPADFVHETVLLVADASSQNEIDWQNGKARLVVPKSGVVHLRSLGLIDGQLFEAQLHGKNHWGFGVTNLRGNRVAELNFSEVLKERSIGLMSEAELERLITDREAAP